MKGSIKQECEFRQKRYANSHFGCCHLFVHLLSKYLHVPGTKSQNEISLYSTPYSDEQSTMLVFQRTAGEAEIKEIHRSVILFVSVTHIGGRMEYK